MLLWQMYVFVFAHVVGEKRLSVLEGFLLQARVGEGEPWRGLRGWGGSSSGPSASSKPLMYSVSPNSLLLSPDLSGASQGNPCWLTLGCCRWGRVDQQLVCGCVAPPVRARWEIRCWLPAIHQPCNKENFKKQRLSLQAKLFSEAGKELRRVCDAVSRIIYK